MFTPWEMHNLNYSSINRCRVVLTGNVVTGSGIRSVRKMTPAHPLIVGQLSCLLLACSLSFCSTHRSALLHPFSTALLSHSVLSLNAFHSALSFSASAFSAILSHSFLFIILDTNNDQGLLERDTHRHHHRHLPTPSPTPSPTPTQFRRAIWTIHRFLFSSPPTPHHHRLTQFYSSALTIRTAQIRKRGCLVASVLVVRGDTLENIGP